MMEGNKILEGLENANPISGNPPDPVPPVVGEEAIYEVEIEIPGFTTFFARIKVKAKVK